MVITILKKIIFLLLFFLLLIFSVAFAYRKGWIKEDYLQKIGLSSEKIINDDGKISINAVKIQVKDDDWKNLGEDGVNQIKILSERALETGKGTQGFLQEAIRVDENNEQTLSEKAFEYGRYVYCQQVVETYQSRFEASPSASDPQ